MRSATPDDPRSDEQLVEAINHGELDAFDALYWRYRDWVVRLAQRFAGNAEDALDVLQEAFAYFYRKFPGFTLTARLTTFLYPVVKNLALAARRKSGRLLLFVDEEGADRIPDAKAVNPGDPAAAELAEMLESLPAIHREVLLMRHVDGMSLEEISAALGVPLGTVKSRLHNAIAALRKKQDD